jgi:AmiR/NasT family two-component response regulator
MRILIAEDETIIRLDLRALLEAAGHEVVAEARDGEEAVALAREHAPELVSRAVDAGVFAYLVKPFREQDLVPALATARARHEELAALREEAASLQEALEARKSIERAKGVLMSKEGLSEQEAFARLRKASQVSGRPMRVIADAVIATLDTGV